MNREDYDTINDIATIINVGPHDWTWQRTHGNYNLPRKPETNEYSLLAIKTAVEEFDIGDKRRQTQLNPARNIALDLAKELTEWGVLAIAGSKPTDNEIRQARHNLIDHYKRLVENADHDWAAHHNYNMIDDRQRLAAREMNLEREWLDTPEERKRCQRCYASIHRQAKVCQFCQAPQKTAPTNRATKKVQ